MLRRTAVYAVVHALFGMSILLVMLGAQDSGSDRVIVAVLDTGVDDSHPMLQGKVIQGFDFVDFKSVSEDTVGHGTHVAGIIASKATGAEILSVRVISNEDRLHNTYLAILYAIAKGARIINMSYAEPYHWLTDLAVRYGRAKGVLFVASSGNRGINGSFYPAKYEGVYSISGLNEREQTIFGNYGTEVHYLAPSVRIRSAGLNGGYAVKTGTSMAAAYVSGVLAYLMTIRPDLSEKEIIQFLDDYSRSEVFAHDDLTEPMEYKIVDSAHIQAAVSGLAELTAAYSHGMNAWNRNN